jgi:hypothetical protein
MDKVLLENDHLWSSGSTTNGSFQIRRKSTGGRSETTNRSQVTRSIGNVSNIVSTVVVDDLKTSSYNETNGSTTLTFSFSVNFDRWKSLAAGIYLQFLVACMFVFSTYSGKLKDVMGMDQDELTAVGTATQIGGSVYAFAGFYYDRRGSSETARIGAMLSAFGYLGIYLCTTGAITTRWLLYLFFFFAFQGCAWMEVSSTAVQIINFPQNRGLVIGLLYIVTSIGGLGVIILVQGFFDTHQRPSNIILCEGDRFKWNGTGRNVSSTNEIDPTKTGGMSVFFCFFIVNGLLGLWSSLFLQPAEPPDTANGGGQLGPGGVRKVQSNYAVALLFAAFVLGVGFQNVKWDREGNVPEGASLWFAWILVILLLFPLLLLLWTKRSMGKLRPPRKADTPRTTSLPNISFDNKTGEEGMGVVDALCSLNFWLLFVVFFGVNGPATLVNVQMGQMNVSLGGSDVDSSLLVLCFCLGLTISRIIVGPLQDVLARCGVSQILLLCICLVINGSAMTMLASLRSRRGGVLAVEFTIAICMIGFSFGSAWVLISPTVAEVFGTKHFGKIATLLYFAYSATFVYNSWIAGPRYDIAYRAKPDYGNPKNKCCGHSCYEDTFSIVAVISFALTLPCMWLHLRTKRRVLNVC